MATIDIRQEVEKAVGLEWTAFAARHPHLAASLDQRLVTDRVTRQLEDDPDYRLAMQNAAGTTWAAQTLQGWVRRFVGDFFREITG